MNRRKFAKLFGAGTVLLPAFRHSVSASQAFPQQPSQTYVSSSPFNVGSQTQLFVDTVLVRDSEQVSFTLHPGQKHPKNPLVMPDKPWEGWQLELYGNVLYDEDERIFKMWYLGVAPGYFQDNSSFTLYATSKDGVAWDKPLVGTVSSPKASKHNVVALVDLASVIKDKEDPDPARRYKMICYVDAPKAARGYHTLISPDSLHWQQFSTKPISPGSDVITGYYDEKRRLFVALLKINTEVRGHKRRLFYVITSHDFLQWTEPQLAFSPDLRDEASSLRRIEEVRSILDVVDDPKEMRTDFYGMGFYPQDSCTLAFPWVFTINNKGRFGNQDGPMEVQLASSRDLAHWDRPFRTPIVPLGAQGTWDSGMIYTQSRALRVGDEIWLYYGGHNATHGNPCFYRDEGTGQGTRYTGGIGLVKWSLDRFVSADGPAEGGHLTTVPIIFSGNHLEVNARVKKGGSLTVEILDAAGLPVKGFQPSEPIQGDHLRQRVSWLGKQDLALVRGKPISLKFRLRGAELYSYAFR